MVRIPIDVVFPVLHGKNGEDGTIQGLFELARIPYVGSGVIGSSVCMDKCVAKILFARAGIPQANWVEIKAGEPDKVDEIEQKLGYPCFIKPSNAGSSVGISKAHNRSELVEGLKLAFAHDYKVLVEEMMTGTEVESSVFGNLRPVCADALGEIAPANEFYDYEAKYKSADSRLTIPAKLEPSVAEKLKEYALRAYPVSYTHLDVYKRQIVHLAVAVGDDQFRMENCRIVGGKFVIIRRSIGNAVWIDPCVEFHSAAMRLFNGKGQGVKTTVRCGSLCTGQITRPGKDIRLIQSVTGRTYLKENGVKSHSICIFNDCREFGFQSIRAGGLPGRIVDVCNR